MLEANGQQAASSPNFALTRFNARRAESESAERSRLAFHRRLARARLILVGLTAVILIFALANFGSTKAWAERILGLTRIEKITPAPSAPLSFEVDLNASLDQQLRQFFGEDFEVTRMPGPPSAADNATEAGLLSGFNVRLPGNKGEPQLKVTGDYSFQVTLNLAHLQTVLNDAGRSDLRLPDDIDGAKISVDIPRAVVANYGDCPGLGPSFTPLDPGWENCLAFVQVTSPTVLTPDGLEPVKLAELGLRAAGMTEEAAKNLAATVDWTSTLLVPIPSNLASYTSVTVDGVEGTLITQSSTDPAQTPFTLMWSKDGMLYWLMGRGDTSVALSMANSLR